MVVAREQPTRFSLACGKFGAAWALEANSDAKIYGGVTSLAQYHAFDELRAEPRYQKLVAQTKE